MISRGKNPFYHLYLLHETSNPKQKQQPQHLGPRRCTTSLQGTEDNKRTGPQGLTPAVRSAGVHRTAQLGCKKKSVQMPRGFSRLVCVTEALCPYPQPLKKEKSHPPRNRESNKKTPWAGGVQVAFHLGHRSVVSHAASRV